MAKLVDATDLIGLSLGMETYQVITFKFRETQEFRNAFLCHVVVCIILHFGAQYFGTRCLAQ